MNDKTIPVWKIISPVLVFIMALVALNPFSVQAAQGGGHPVVSYATRSDTTAPLKDLPKLPPLPDVLGRVFEKPRKNLPNRQSNTGPTGQDPALQTSAPVPSAATVGPSFEGIGNVDGVLPPDTNGDIGPNHYVQMVNLSFAIYSRDSNNPNQLTLEYGPANTNTLWQGFGGPCETTNDGDPVVLYDQLADRWMMSQFALPNYPRGPFYQCIAVSQTASPLGAWNRYEFQISNSKLNDYPKFGVWPDGYYMSINQFSCKFIGCSWGGAGAVAFERDAMLNGQSARMVYFDLYNVDPNLGGMLPADLDGPVPLAGAPNPFAQMDDNSWGYSGDQLQVWNFHVDWNNPSNSTFTFDRALPVDSFDSDMCGYARNCIPQPGGTNVDALSDRLMFRLQYRNFGSYQTMVVNHTVDANGSDRAGVRWYELRDTGSGWGVHQQGTFSPDSANRWVGSVAMNSAGDIGLGYSVSSTSIFPSIRFTGRLDGDPLGQMTQGEGTIVNGNGYQTHTSGRWGDYAMLAVDPVDDCTFWFTSEYYSNPTTSADWRTRIGSFKLADCGTPVDNAPTVTITNPSNGATVSSSLNVTANASDDNGVTQVEFFVDGGSIGVDTTEPYSVSWDTIAYSDGAHTVSAVATDTIGQTGNDSVSVTVQNTPVDNNPTVTITNPTNGATVSSSLNVTANAADDNGVTQVEFFVDGGSIGVDTTEPYSVSWDTTAYNDGVHTVSAVVTDTVGQTGNDSVSVTVQNAPAATIHVGNMSGSATVRRNNWSATVVITVYDSGDSPVANVTVTGNWSGASFNGGSNSCITDSSGQCSVSTGNIKNDPSVTYTVTDLTGTGYIYDAGANVVTSITVVQ